MSGDHPPPARPPGTVALLRRTAPYVVGALMFALAAWVLHGTLARYDAAELGAELERLGPHRIGLAILFTGLSFVALMGYEASALRLIGRKVPLREFSLASFVTQSIAHSTGFAFLIGATLRYQLYAARGLTLGDVARIQIYFTATFTLGVSTLAGAVLLVEPSHLAAATHLPAALWRAGAALALVLVGAYVTWGAFFHRPFAIRGRVLTLPDAPSTLIQIFWGVADLLAVAAALYALLPASLGLGYFETLAIFMASIVVGLMSNVPGSLGVFESAVLLLVRPDDAQTLPLLGALLAFRACYYLLPLLCGVTLLTLTELARWSRLAGPTLARSGRRLAPFAAPAASFAALAAGALLLLATATPVPEARAERLAAAFTPAILGWGNLLSSVTGLALVVLARGLQLSAAMAWRGSVALVLLGIAVCLLSAEKAALVLLLALALGALLLCRQAFTGPTPAPLVWLTPAWLLMMSFAAGLAVLVIVRG